MNAGAKGRPETEISNAIQQCIDTLNERFTNKTKKQIINKSITKYSTTADK
jgi:hypothetical protein